MTRTSLGSWLSALRRRRAPVRPVTPAPGWKPLPDDIAEWMGARPYPLCEGRAPSRVA